MILAVRYRECFLAVTSRRRVSYMQVQANQGLFRRQIEAIRLMLIWRTTVTDGVAARLVSVAVGPTFIRAPTIRRFNLERA